MTDQRIVLVPVPGDPKEAAGMVSMSAGQPLDLPLWEEDGQEFVPAFTSEAQLLGALGQGSRFIALPLADLLDLLKGDREVRLDVARGDPDPGTGFAIGEPAEEPEDLLREIERFCSGNAAVLTAWRALVKLEGEAPQPLIGLELSAQADPVAVMALVTGDIERAGLGPIVVVPVNRHAPDEFTEYLLSSTRPFWPAQSARPQRGP